MSKSIPTLQDSPRTKVFRAMMSILKHDPVLTSVVKGPSFRTWDGSATDTADFSNATCPALRFLPTNGPEQFQFPDAQVGPLFVEVHMLVAGNNVDDPQNLWWAIERAIYPTDWNKRVANQSALQAAGAKTGLVFFTQPAFDPGPENRYFACQGQMKVDVLLQLNT
jgi:hypothetical protein